MATSDELSSGRRIELATQRLHILEAILQAFEHPHRVLDLLLEAKDADEGRSALAAEFGWDTIQATAVMDVQLRRVTHADRNRIRQDAAQVRVESDG